MDELTATSPVSAETNNNEAIMKTPPHTVDRSNATARSGHDLQVDLFRAMLRIQKVQLHIESRYHMDEMKTPVHLCIGQEAIAVGICAALETRDYISSNHRGHGHYLAKGGDLNAMIAELHCRETGCSKGRGGSMHLVDVAVGHLGSSSIVGGGIPIATGLALSSQMKGEDRVCATFFGDGAADEGVLYESINFAVLKKLPVLFVLEDNKFSVCSRVEARHGGPMVFHGLPEECIFTAKVDGNDVLAVYDTAVKAVERARKGDGPSFIECTTYRMRGHAGSGSDAKLGYRTEAEIAAWEEKDPVATFRKHLLARGALDDAALEAMEREIDKEVHDAFAFALKSNVPSGEDVEKYLYRD